MNNLKTRISNLIPGKVPNDMLEDIENYVGVREFRRASPNSCFFVPDSWDGKVAVFNKLAELDLELKLVTGCEFPFIFKRGER